MKTTEYVARGPFAVMHVFLYLGFRYKAGTAEKEHPELVAF